MGLLPKQAWWRMEWNRSHPVKRREGHGKSVTHRFLALGGHMGRLSGHPRGGNEEGQTDFLEKNERGGATL